MGCFGLILLVVIAGLSAWVRHVRDPTFWRASLLAALQAAIVWTALVVLLSGHRASGIGGTAAFALLWSFVVACTVGGALRLGRRPKDEG